MAPATPIRLGSIGSIDVASADGNADSGTMTLHCEIDGRASTVPVPISADNGMRLQKVAFLTADPSDRGAELKAHLQANRAYYSRAVLSSLDTANLSMLLSPFSWNGKPLIDQVEPVPVTVAGNYLVLRAPVDDSEPAGFGTTSRSWEAVLKERGMTAENNDTRLIPIPTDGVFAEAVLGHSNSAEKLDITRFWNWQDSPSRCSRRKSRLSIRAAAPPRKISRRASFPRPCSTSPTPPRYRTQPAYRRSSGRWRTATCSAI